MIHLSDFFVECKKCQNISKPVEYLREDEMIDLQNRCAKIYFRENETIFKQGMPATHIAYIKSGLVKVLRTENNRSFISEIVQHGFFVGLDSLFGSGIHQFTIICISQCSICLIDKELLISFMHKNHEFSYQLLKTSCEDHIKVMTRIMKLMHKQTPGKIADLLLFFSNEIFQSLNFEMPISRNDLAELAGISKKSIIKILQEYKKDGLIDLQGKKISIKRIDLLMKLSSAG